MDKIFSGLKGFIKLDKLSIDNHVFRLHYKVTVALLMGFSILVTSRQYIGDPIDCISKDSVPSKILDSFCWIHSTFSVKHAWHKKVGSQVPYPGVDKYTPGEERVYHAYYQWVCFVLFFQAALFYVPRYLWKAAEGRKISSLVMDLSDPINDDKKRNDDIDILCRYFQENRGYHRGYVFYFFLCEFLNFINVVGQIYLVDNFLGGEFSTYGSKVFQFTEWDPSVRFDPMIQVFPRLTKCTFHMYGSSGDVQKYDAMCILPINIINEKIYVFMWFWFLILAFVSGFMIIYRALIVFYPPARYHVLAARARLAETKDLYTICHESDLGDWFLVSLLSKNLDSVAYRMFARKLREQLEENAKGSKPYAQATV
ncbi:innexin inx2 [Galendromus occidentalis]|uniref:Innexin n=1 Tax=Galendromus occidentalis TaxID=34638 RepID=A0AAJ6VZK0_9ACAR|nr:innexin inx2 [Galendromus occidentalis]